MNDARAKWDAVFNGCLLKGPRQLAGAFYLQTLMGLGKMILSLIVVPLFKNDRLAIFVFVSKQNFKNFNHLLLILKK
jgi:hypothetical protein